MTALHPLDSKIEVVGVVAARYPINNVCAHPTCDRTDITRHHVFARSKTGSGSWFVALDPKKVTRLGDKHKFATEALPHVVGLCGHGTDGHHGDVEEHRAWIRLTEDGTFVWWERKGEDWKEIGPLDPQPGARIKHIRPKKRDRRTDGKPRNRERYTFAIPKDEQEDGADVLDDLVARCREIAGSEDLPAYYILVPALKLLVEDPDWKGMYADV